MKMERFRQKRSKSAGLADRSSGRALVVADAASRQGNRQIKKQSNLPKLASDSSSCSSGITEDDLFTFELGHNSTQRVIGAPMKKLLAEEMIKETGSKRRPPSIIARLMGLDGLPPHQPAHKQQKRLSENYQQRTASIESQRNGTSYEGHHHRKTSKEQLEFKDVFEVKETPKGEGGSLPLQGTESSMLTEAKMEFIRQKFMDVKRLSTNEMLQDSKEFHDALEVLDSNKDLLLKFLQEPDSLFTKHLHDLQSTPLQSHCSHIAVMRSANPPKLEKNAIGWRSGRGASCKSDKNCPQKHHDGLLRHSCGRRGVHSSLKSEDQLEGKDETHILPTRIVVLKPNLGKAQNSTKSVSSSHSSHAFTSDCTKHTRFLSNRLRETELWEEENLSIDMEPSRCNSRESREIAKEITKRMKNGFNSGSINLSPLNVRGYAGDESSGNLSGNDSANESEMRTLTPRSSFDCSNRYGPSPSHSTESSVNREAKKRLSERWKMTRTFQQVKVVSRGSTLGEMLAVPDKEMQPKNLDSRIGQEGFNSNDKTAGWVGPLGISSRDGWKDGCIANLSRSRSLPASSVAFGSPKASMRHEALDDDRYIMPKEAINRGRNKAAQRNFNQKDILSSRNLRSSNRKSWSPRSTNRESSDTLLDIYYSQNHVKSNFEGKDLSEQKPMLPEASAGIVTDRGSVLDEVADAEHENMITSSEFPDNLLQEASDCILVKADSSSHDLDDYVPQEPSIGQSEEGSVPLCRPVPEPESPASSKETDQPSPVSVLEPPFTEDLSSGSECFERVSADLHGLRMQLQLLKLESEAYVEGPMLVSSDEDIGEESVGFSEEKRVFRSREYWESSYLVDLLTHCNFDDTDADSFMAAGHSPEWPIGPLIFEKLEKKYCDQITWLRSERRLLFDRINSGLVDIFPQFMNHHPWVVPLTKRVRPSWHKDELEDELCTLLASQEKNVKGDTAAKVLGKESEWLSLGDEIDVIGSEVERLLIDELVREVVIM